MRGAGINTIGGQVQVLELDVPLPIASDEVLIAVKTARSRQYGAAAVLDLPFRR
jgi:hypothetical protein